MVAVLGTGVSLIIEQYGGLYWLVPTVLLFVLWSVNNAWQISGAGRR